MLRSRSVCAVSVLARLAGIPRSGQVLDLLTADLPQVAQDGLTLCRPLQCGPWRRPPSRAPAAAPRACPYWPAAPWRRTSRLRRHRRRPGAPASTTAGGAVRSDAPCYFTRSEPRGPGPAGFGDRPHRGAPRSTRSPRTGSGSEDRDDEGRRLGREGVDHQGTGQMPITRAPSAENTARTVAPFGLVMPLLMWPLSQRAVTRQHGTARRRRPCCPR